MSALPAPNQWTQGKNHHTHGVGYDNFYTIDFDSITLTVSMATTSAQAYYPLPCTHKIFGVEVVAIGTTLSGLLGFNITMGTVAASGFPTPDNSEAGVTPPTPAVNGNCVFNVPGGGGPQEQSITAVNGVPQWFPVAPPYFDAVWPQNALMTVRVHTGSTVASLSNGATLKVIALAVPYDPIGNRPYSTMGGTAPAYQFNPVNDVT